MNPNEAYEVVPIEPAPHGPPVGWWTVERNGLPVRHFPGKEKAERFATDPEYRASLAAGKAEGEGEIIRLQGHRNIGLGALLSSQLLGLVRICLLGDLGTRPGAEARSFPSAC
jgi:hypothetical protein